MSSDNREKNSEINKLVQLVNRVCNRTYGREHRKLRYGPNETFRDNECNIMFGPNHKVKVVVEESVSNGKYTVNVTTNGFPSLTIDDVEKHEVTPLLDSMKSLHDEYRKFMSEFFNNVVMEKDKV